MAYNKKTYRRTDPKTGRRQKRSASFEQRKPVRRTPHRYPTRPLYGPDGTSPGKSKTFKAAVAAKRLLLKYPPKE